MASASFFGCPNAVFNANLDLPGAANSEKSKREGIDVNFSDGSSDLYLRFCAPHRRLRQNPLRFAP